MARPYPREFRDDVVRVARNRDDGVTIEQIATDFGVHPMTLQKWLRQADIDEGAKPGKTTGEHPEADLRHVVRGIVRRGLAPQAPKTAISLRIEQDVLEWFKAQGPGYQTRMNAVLRAYRDASV